MSKPILVANWKNHPGSLSAAQALLKDLSKKRDLYKKISLFIAPPAAYLESAGSRSKGFARLAVQNISELPKGAYTGEITPEILKSFGVRLSIVGHSERRALGESSEMVSQKIKIALKAGIAPLLCFGESERDSDGEHFEFLRQELKRILGSLSKSEISRIALAYEPVWAVGERAKGVISPEELAQTIVFVRKTLSDLFGRKIAEGIPVLYGGSVDPSNAKELMETGIRGFLVGRASLNAKSFEAIVRDIISK